jgi:hypothetical protein
LGKEEVGEDVKALTCEQLDLKPKLSLGKGGPGEERKRKEFFILF